MYQTLPDQPTFFQKAKKNLWLIISISLINYSIALAFTLLVYRRQEDAFLGIALAALISFFLSQSHLLIYGVSNLSILLFLKSNTPQDHRANQIALAIAGLILLFFCNPLQKLGKAFYYLPPKLHLGVILGICFIVLAEFLPLALSNANAFYSQIRLAYSPTQYFNIMVSDWQLLGVLLTGITIFLMLMFRRYLKHIPLVVILFFVGILLNRITKLTTLSSLTSQGQISLKLQGKVVIPQLKECIQHLPRALILAIVLAFQQMLYAEQIRQRKLRYDLKRFMEQQPDDYDLVGNREFILLGIVNLTSGLLVGMPLAISLFSSHQHFFQTEEIRFRGTKVVGLLQAALNSVWLIFGNIFFMQLPLWTLFCIIIVPVAYYVSHIARLLNNKLLLVLSIGILTVFTHPAFALLLGSFYTIYQLVSLVQTFPAQITFSQMREPSFLQVRRQTELIRKSESTSRTVARLNALEQDYPPSNIQSYTLYRMTGIISYINFVKHKNQVQFLLKEKSLKSKQKDYLIFSFRYVHNIDQHAIKDFGILVQAISQRFEGKVMITGLHTTLVKTFCEDNLFARLIQQREVQIFRMQGNDFKTEI